MDRNRVIIRTICWAIFVALSNLMCPTHSLTFSKCTVPWHNAQHVNMTVQCRRTRVNATLQTYYPLNVVWFNLTLSTPTFGAQDHSFSPILSHEENICNLAKGTSSQPFFAEVYKIAMASPNNHLNTKCPIQPDTYFVRNYSFSGTMLDRLLMNAKILLTLALRDEHRQLGTFVIEATIRRNENAPRRQRTTKPPQ